MQSVSYASPCGLDQRIALPGPAVNRQKVSKIEPA